MVVHIGDRLTSAEESRMIAVLAATKDQVLLRHVSWRTYQQLLDAWGPKAPRHTYDRGSLEIMAKSSIHEILKSVLGFLLAVLCEELDIDFIAGGETTLAKEDVDRGLEPDQCFWIANAGKVEGKLSIDFEHDPPPDLFVEVEVTRTILDRIAVLAALGVPEVWRFDGVSIEVGLLESRGEYRWGSRSLAFPSFPVPELVSFLKQTESASHLKIIRAFRAWLRAKVVK